jgi:hypothetical protein
MTTMIMLCAFGLSTPAQPATPGATAVSAVAKLYQDFAAEAVIDSPELSIEDLFGRPKATLSRYLDDALVSLVLADRACSRRTQEVCSLDFSPIWDAQDAVGTVVKISDAKDPSRVLVELQTPDHKDLRRLTYRMVKTPAGWRVHDIEYDSHESLVAMLKHHQ